MENGSTPVSCRRCGVPPGFSSSGGRCGGGRRRDAGGQPSAPPSVGRSSWRGGARAGGGGHDRHRLHPRPAGRWRPCRCTAHPERRLSAPIGLGPTPALPGASPAVSLQLAARAAADAAAAAAGRWCTPGGCPSTAAQAKDGPVGGNHLMCAWARSPRPPKTAAASPPPPTRTRA